MRGIATIVMAAVFCVTSLGLALASTAKSVEAPLSPVGLDNGNGKVEERMAADRLHASASPGGGVLLCGDLLQNLDFEQGMPPLSTAWSAFKATVPAMVATDPDGNSFIRITATDAEGGASGSKLPEVARKNGQQAPIAPRRRACPCAVKDEAADQNVSG